MDSDSRAALDVRDIADIFRRSREKIRQMACRIGRKDRRTEGQKDR